MAVLDLSGTGALTDPLINGLNRILPKLPAALIALLAGIVLIKVLGWIFELVIGLVRLPKGLKSILHSLISVILWVLLVISILQVLGLGSVIFVFSGSLLAAGLALSGGASSLAADVLGGIFLAKDRDFSVGDKIRAGEDGTEGIIESMDMRRTRIRAHDGKLHVIPNAVIERKEWVLLAKKSELTK